MKLRRVQPTKWRETLDKLQAECFPYDTPCAYLPNDLWWIAFDGEQAVGFCAVRPSLNYPDTWYLCRAGVLSSHRGRGLQKRMIRARVAAARRAGASAVITDCTVENCPSANSLIACGFRLFRPPNKWATAAANYWRLIF